MQAAWLQAGPRAEASPRRPQLHRAKQSGPKAAKKTLADKKKRGLSTEKTNTKARRGRLHQLA